MNNYSLVIMAAGLGSRYGGLKQLEAFNEATLLEYSIHDAIKNGCRHLIFIIRPDMEDTFHKHILNKIPSKIKIDLGYQSIPEGRKKPYGTGHAVLQAKQFIHQSFVVINADDYYGPGAFELLSIFFKRNNIDMCLIAYRLENTLSENGGVSRGICKINNQYEILDIQEHTHIERLQSGTIVSQGGEGLQPETLVSMNCWGFRPGFLDFLNTEFEKFKNKYSQFITNEFYLPSVANKWIALKKGKILAIPNSEKWCGITYQEDKSFVEAHLKEQFLRGIYPQKNLLEI